MNCPKCNGVMKKGYIPSYKGKLIWTPYEVGHPILVTSVPKRAIQLTKTTIMDVQKKTAFHCPDCHIIIMSTIKEYE